MNVGKSSELGKHGFLFEGVVTERTSCFDTHFVSQSKLTEFPLIHCFVTRLNDNTFVQNLSIILDYNSVSRFHWQIGLLEYYLNCS